MLYQTGESLNLVRRVDVVDVQPEIPFIGGRFAAVGPERTTLAVVERVQAHYLPAEGRPEGGREVQRAGLGVPVKRGLGRDLGDEGQGPRVRWQAWVYLENGIRGGLRVEPAA